MTPRIDGFSLIELMVTLAILGVLAMLVMPAVQNERQRSKEQDLRRALHEIRHGIDEYKRASDEGKIAKQAGSSGYPATLAVLVEGVANKADLKHAKIFFLRRIPRDPMQDNSALSDEDSWGLRSYESDADNPTSGNDVYDAYSTSNGLGLNGVPYAKW